MPTHQTSTVFCIVLRELLKNKVPVVYHRHLEAIQIIDKHQYFWQTWFHFGFKLRPFNESELSKNYARIDVKFTEPGHRRLFYVFDSEIVSKDQVYFALEWDLSTWQERGCNAGRTNQVLWEVLRFTWKPSHWSSRIQTILHCSQFEDCLPFKRSRRRWIVPSQLSVTEFLLLISWSMLFELHVSRLQCEKSSAKDKAVFVTGSKIRSPCKEAVNLYA